MYQLKGYDGISIGAGQPLLVMAGLNVLEDEGLALEVAAELKQICSDLSYLMFLRRVLIKQIDLPSPAIAGPDRLADWLCWRL